MHIEGKKGQPNMSLGGVNGQSNEVRAGVTELEVEETIGDDDLKNAVEIFRTLRRWKNESMPRG